MYVNDIYNYNEIFLFTYIYVLYVCCHEWIDELKIKGFKNLWLDSVIRSETRIRPVVTLINVWQHAEWKVPMDRDTCMYKMYVCMYVCVRMAVCVCMYVCMYVYICMCMYVMYVN